MVEKRDEILDAALSLITEEGFHNLTLARIFAAANTGPGTFYHYFKNKNELVTALFEKCCKKEESLLSKYKDTSLPFQARLEVIILEILKAYETNPRELGFVQWYCNNGIEDAFAKTSRTSPSTKALYNVILEAQKQGIVPEEVPAHSAAKTIRSTVSIVFWHHKTHRDTNLEELSKNATQRAMAFVS